MAEETPLGIRVEGHPSDVKGSIVPFATPRESQKLKDEMYKDFLLAKSQGEIALDYHFQSWVNRSLNMLREHRKRDILSEWEMGKIGKAEYDALEEMRVKMIEAIVHMDLSDLDAYGIQHLDLSKAAAATVESAPTNGRQKMTPEHRKNVVKFPGQDERMARG
jgi:hypothetical protein